MANEQTQGYKGRILIGGAQYPILPGARLSAPRNTVNPPFIGNFFESWQFAEGLISPVFQCNFLVRDSTSEVLSATFLDYFFARTVTVDHDTLYIPGGIKFWDGRRGWSLYGVKADRLSLSFVKGGGIQMSATFCASNADAGHVAMEALGAAPSFATFDSAPLLYGQHITFGGALAGLVFGANLDLANNHRASEAMNGSIYPAEQNASQFTASASLRMRTSSTPPVDDTAITIVLTGANVTRTFTLQNPQNQTPNDLSQDYPEVFRSYQLKLRGTTSNGAPVAYS
jgi:hypothetical protein